MMARLGCLGVLAACLLVPPAHAQVSGSVSLVSDYRFRGVSLSDGKPALQSGVAYDHDSGWYAGGFASTAQFDDDAHAGVEIMAYAGRAGRLTPSLSWDLGIAQSTFANHHDYDYADYYGGLTAGSLNVRLHYARDYFGLGQNTAYVEANDAWPLGDSLHLVAHFGFVRRTSAGDGGRCARDARVGVSFSALGLRTEIAATTISAGYPGYPVSEGQRRQALILALSKPF